MSLLSMNRSHNIAEAVFSHAKPSLSRDFLLVIAGSILIALSAQVAIPLPFTPIPVTGQTFAILMVGMALGPRRGALAAIAYLAEGAAGLPVFANGAAGLPYMMGPTAGYLLGFIPAAFTAGFLAQRGWDRNPITTALAMLLGNIMIYIPGLIILGVMLNLSLNTTLAYGFLPFYGGDIVKIILAAAAMPIAWKIIGQKK